MTVTNTQRLGCYNVRWFDVPYLPHAWECGLKIEERAGTIWHTILE